MKRMLIFMLALALLVPSALAETFVVNYWGSEEAASYALLITEDGAPLTPPQTYADLYLLTPAGTPEAQRLYSAEPFAMPADKLAGVDEDDYRTFTFRALVDGAGRQLTGFDYYDLAWVDGVVVARRWPMAVDVLDGTGKVLITGPYADIRPNGEGGWLALKRDGQEDDEYGGVSYLYAIVAVDASGAESETGFHTFSYEMNDFDGGLCPVLDVRELDGRAVFLDAAGAQALGRDFNYIGGVAGGKAVVEQGDRYGLLDLAEDSYILEPVYDYICLEDGFAQKVFWVHKGDTLAVYDPASGNELFTRRFEGAEYPYGWLCGDGTLMLSGGNGWEICTLSGLVLFRVDPDREVGVIYSECEGVPQRYVEYTGEYPNDVCHLIDLSGEPVGGDWQNLNAALWRDGHGRYVTNTYDLVDDGEGGVYPSWYSYRYGVCDENGRMVLESRYLNVEVLSLDRYWVQTADRCGMIDGKGNWYYTVEDYQYLMD